jgi:hypothetical protein
VRLGDFIPGLQLGGPIMVVDAVIGLRTLDLCRVGFHTCWVAGRSCPSVLLDCESCQ